MDHRETVERKKRKENSIRKASVEVVGVQSVELSFCYTDCSMHI